MSTNAAALDTGSQPIASRRHTIILALIFVVIAAAGAYSRSRGGSAGMQSGAGPSTYLSIIAAELALMYYVWRGTRKQLPAALDNLIGGGWTSVGIAVRDVTIAAAVWGIWIAIHSFFDRVLPHAVSAPPGLLPHGIVNGSLWVALSIAAGFAEEIVFRGYFMRQMRALTGKTWAAVLIQAALFSVAHGYEGLSACLKIAAFGLLYGAVALWQRNLRACIIAHAWTDIAAGLLRI